MRDAAPRYSPAIYDKNSRRQCAAAIVPPLHGSLDVSSGDSLIILSKFSRNITNDVSTTKMAEVTDFGTKRMIFVFAIVVACFAVLWPKIFYPMLVATVTPHPTLDSSACCEVIFESDVTAVDIMQEMCQNILRHHSIDPRVRDALKLNELTPQSASLCREEVLARCGIDLSSFLAQRERLGKTYKQVLEEIRSFNSSLCLKTNFGVPLSQLGTPHLIRYHILMPHSTIRQERRTPPHAGGMHPALRERGRAIPSSHIVPKIIERSDYIIPKTRPPLGSAGRVVSAPQGSGTMGIIMPLYTIGIVLFFLYTIVKVLRKNSDSEIVLPSEYRHPGMAAEKEFQKMVFNPEIFATAMTAGLHYTREKSPDKTAPIIDELKELDEVPKSNGLAGVGRSCKEDNGTSQEYPMELHSKEDEEVDIAEQSPTVKVMGMEMTASCESGQKYSRPTTPIIFTPPSNVEKEKTPPKPIYLEGALPSQCELLVTDSETQAEKSEDDDDAPVVLSGKMTLSLISLDQIAADSEDEAQNEQSKEILGISREDNNIKDIFSREICLEEKDKKKVRNRTKDEKKEKEKIEIKEVDEVKVEQQKEEKKEEEEEEGKEEKVKRKIEIEEEEEESEEEKEEEEKVKRKIEIEEEEESEEEEEEEKEQEEEEEEIEEEDEEEEEEEEEEEDEGNGTESDSIQYSDDSDV